MNNIVELLEREVVAHHEQPAFIQRRREITYGDFWMRVKRRAAAFRDRGIGRDDRVLVFVPMSIDLYEILCALFYVGATAVFLDAWATRERLDLSLKIASCKACIMIPKAWLLLFRSREMRKVPVKMLPGAIAKKPTEQLPESQAGTALITFTTGSTGMPKATKRTHRFLMEQQRILAKEMDLPRGAVDLATLPIFALGNLASGLTTLIPSFDMRHPGHFAPRPVIEEAKRHKVASTCASPAFFECLMGGMKAWELPELKHIATGGAMVDPLFAARMLQAFPNARAMAIYGSTEAEPIASLPLAELAQCRGCLANGLPTGKVVPEIDIAILPMETTIRHEYSRDEWDGLRLPAESIGEICVAGPHVLKEYFGNPQAFLENKIRVGTEIYHRTGDAGRLDKDGNLYLYGRVSTAFKDGAGHWTFTMLCEVRLKYLPGVRAGTVLKMPEGVTAFLETSLPRPEAERLMAESGLSFQRLVILSHIPRDPRHNSKIDYGALREMA